MVGPRRLRLDGEASKSAATLAAYLPIQLLLPSVGDFVFGDRDKAGVYRLGLVPRETKLA
ncbi:MAG: hypothetical protein CM15mP68_7520 [Pseudomonadota bacterium]|nr:MAG: hypothetical protein CM15mP68_7520 [Pseudomonadota bacterium]